jgi:uncharacterized protein (UPF0333 family)
MKMLSLLLAVVFAGGLAYAAEKPVRATHKASHAAITHHDVAAEIVSVDAASHSITLKTDKGEQTVPVEGKAVASLKNVKAGEKVTVTCKDVGGEHKSVTAIKMGGSKTTKS